MTKVSMMRESLKKVVVPELRKSGFKGSFAHFRRPQDDHIELLFIYLLKSGDGVRVETSICSLDGYTTHWGEKIPPNKVKVDYMDPDKRYNIGEDKPEFVGGIIFFFEDFQNEAEFDILSKEILSYLKLDEKNWIKNKIEKKLKKI